MNNALALISWPRFKHGQIGPLLVWLAAVK